MHAYFVLRMPEELQISPYVLSLILEGKAAGSELPTFSVRF